MNDPVIIEELGKMLIDNAEEVNDEDAKLDADDEAGFDNEEVDLGLEELDEVAYIVSAEEAG